MKMPRAAAAFLSSFASWCRSMQSLLCSSSKLAESLEHVLPILGAVQLCLAFAEGRRMPVFNTTANFASYALPDQP